MVKDLFFNVRVRQALADHLDQANAAWRIASECRQGE